MSEAVVVSRLSELSLPEIHAIEQESNSPPWSEQMLRDEFGKPTSLVYGVRSSGNLVGFLIAQVVGDQGEILNFAVKKNFRRRGLGRQLLGEALAQLHFRGVRTVTLEVRESNSAAHGLYKELGFADIGLRERYYLDNRENAAVKGLNLTQFVMQHGERFIPEFPLASN